jgi:hypothetical protein
MKFTGKKPLKKSFRSILSIPKMTTSLILEELMSMHWSASGISLSGVEQTLIYRRRKVPAIQN